MIQISFPFNYGEISKFENLNFFKKNSNIIKEVYTVPFFLCDYKDALTDFDYNIDCKKALKILNEINSYGIDINLTFNNLDYQYNISDEKLLKYSYMVKSLTVPNKSWLKYKSDFIIKNTVINLPTFEQVKNGEYDDYDIINIHADIIHNHDLWKSIKGSRKFACVSNFYMCMADCPIKDKHYKLARHNLTLKEQNFCPAEKMDWDEVLLKRCRIPSLKKEYDYYSDVIDIFKLEGRNSNTTFKEACEIVNILNGKRKFVEEEKYVYMKIRSNLCKYFNKIHNCSGECKKCNFCTKILK